MHFKMLSNPYSNQDFLGFLMTALSRCYGFITGGVKFRDIASDEIQILVLILIGISCSWIGTFLILKKMTMLANSLSHTILLGMVLSYLIIHALVLKQGELMMQMDMKTLLLAALCTGFLTTWLTNFLNKYIGLGEDASIGLVFTTLFAAGIVLVTALTRNMHMGTEAIMGNVDALHRDDLNLTMMLFVMNIVIIVLFFKELVLTTFDTQLASNFGYPVAMIQYGLMFLTSATAIGGFRAVGIFLFLALLVIPPMIARLFSAKLKQLIVISSCISFVASFLAVAISRAILSSYKIALSTSGILVTLLSFIYLIAVILSPKHGLMARYWHRKKIIQTIQGGPYA